MNPTVLAMRRPITTLMLVVALIGGGGLAYTRMRVDIFPALNVPKIYVFLDYIGMSPDQMEGFIVNELELYFQYGDGPGRGDVRPGNVVDGQGDLAADDHADGLWQRSGRLPRVRERCYVAGSD